MLHKDAAVSSSRKRSSEAAQGASSKNQVSSKKQVPKNRLDSNQEKVQEQVQLSIPANTGGATRVLLSTAKVLIQNREGVQVPCRVLLDSAS